MRVERWSRVNGWLHPMLWVGVGLCLLTVAACTAGQMRDQPKFETFEPNPFFDDGLSARPLVPNTVAQGELRTDAHFYRGLEAGAPATTFPFTVTLAVLERGQERYGIFCSPCHGYDGAGNGLIVQRGFSPPPSFHTERLRDLPPGYVFDVITNGFGTMYDYADRVPPADRWAIVAYLRALQLSQNASVDDVPAEEQGQLGQ